MTIEIVDVGSGNIKSIQNWIERLNIQTRVITKANNINSNFVILPGVGSAGSYMERMKKTGFDKAITEHVLEGNKLLGICLGFQIMGNYSDEDGGVEGLSLINGCVKKLRNSTNHNGWEKFSLKKDDLENNSFYSDFKISRKRNINGRVFYNHEYGFINDDISSFNIAISSEYNDYSALVVKNNIIGIQFHPEKSQNTGLELISMIL